MPGEGMLAITEKQSNQRKGLVAHVLLNMGDANLLLWSGADRGESAGWRLVARLVADDQDSRRPR